MSISKSERLEYRNFSTEEKLKAMNLMIKYIKENTSTDEQGSRDVNDLYYTCKVAAYSYLYRMVSEHIID